MAPVFQPREAQDGQCFTVRQPPLIKEKITTALAGQQEQRNVAANSMCQHGRHYRAPCTPGTDAKKSRRRPSEIISDQRPVRKINAKEHRALRRAPCALSSSPTQLGRECWRQAGANELVSEETGWSPLPERWGRGRGVGGAHEQVRLPAPGSDFN